MGPVGSRLPRGAVTGSASRSMPASLVQFTEGSATFLPDWLRDNCQCDRVPHRADRRAPLAAVDRSRRRRWSTRSTSSTASCRSTGRAATGRRTDLAEWEKIRTTGARGAWTARLWSAGYEVERFDHHQCIADQVTRRGMFEALRRDGAVVVTGSPTEPGTVIELLRSIGLTLRDSSLGSDLRRQARSGRLQHRVHRGGGASAQRQRPVHPSAQRPGAGDAGQRRAGWQQRGRRRLVGARPARTASTPMPSTC